MPRTGSQRLVESPRLAGLVYLLLIACGLFAEFFVRQSLQTPGDPSATASAILASPLHFRLGLGADLLMVVCDLFLAFAFYRLLCPVDKALAQLAAIFRLAHAAILGLNLLNHISALRLLESASLLQAFPLAQLQALALFRLEEHAQGYLLAQVFFGLHCILLGRLLGLSTLVPRMVAGLVLLGGAGYLLESGILFLAPQAVGWSAWGVALAGIAEILLATFLLRARHTDPAELAR